MKYRYLYLLLGVAGVFLPYSQFLPWLMDHGLDFRLFFHELFANRISGFFALDVLLSAIAVACFAVTESRRLKLQNIWLVIAALCLVGVSLGLPLFLYFRERSLERAR